MAAQESGKKNNWNRSWDKLENGNEWINLNQKRKYQRILKINEIKFNKSVKLYRDELRLYGNAVFIADSIDTTVELAQVMMTYLTADITTNHFQTVYFNTFGIRVLCTHPHSHTRTHMH